MDRRISPVKYLSDDRQVGVVGIEERDEKPYLHTQLGDIFSPRKKFLGGCFAAVSAWQRSQKSDEANHLMVQGCTLNIPSFPMPVGASSSSRVDTTLSRTWLSLKRKVTGLPPTAHFSKRTLRSSRNSTFGAQNPKGRMNTENM